MPDHIRVEMRAQFLSRNRPTPVAIPKTPNAITQPSMLSAMVITAGDNLPPLGTGEIWRPRKPINPPNNTNRLPTIATIPAAVTEAEALFCSFIDACLYQVV